MHNYFYGWYFRCQGKDGSVAIIPAIHLSSQKQACSIQIITQKGSIYKEFPISQFHINRKKETIRIEKNIFSRKGIRLEMECLTPEKVTARVILNFGKFHVPKYDIMGPFKLLSGMECSHTVYSMRHIVNGYVSLNEKYIRFENDLGYMEGDSGISFPKKYIWTQHFLPIGSFMISAASIPLSGINFIGTVGFLLTETREYRFATYLSARVKKLNEKELLICQGDCRLHVEFPERGGHILQAPNNGNMTRKIKENISCKMELTLTYRNRTLLHEFTDRAAVECDFQEIP